MDIVTGVELECSYGAGDGWTRSGVASMPKERSGRPRLDWSCDWEKYGYDTQQLLQVVLTSMSKCGKRLSPRLNQSSTALEFGPMLMRTGPGANGLEGSTETGSEKTSLSGRGNACAKCR